MARKKKKRDMGKQPYYMVCGIGRDDRIYSTFVYGRSCRVGNRKYNPVFGVITTQSDPGLMHDLVSEHVQDKRFFIEDSIAHAFDFSGAESFFIDMWQPIIVPYISPQALVDYAISIMPPGGSVHDEGRGLWITTGIVAYRYGIAEKFLRSRPDNTVRIYMSPEKDAMFGSYYGEDRLTIFGRLLEPSDVYDVLRMRLEEKMGELSSKGWELFAHVAKDADEADAFLVDRLVHGTWWGIGWANMWLRHQPIATTREIGRA